MEEVISLGPSSDSYSDDGIYSLGFRKMQPVYMYLLLLYHKFSPWIILVSFKEREKLFPPKQSGNETRTIRFELQ